MRSATPGASPSASYSRALAQVAISTCDWLMLTTALYLLIPPGGRHLAFGTVAAASLLAQVMGVASNLPGGVGVFDAAVLTLLGAWVTVLVPEPVFNPPPLNST